MSSLSCCHDLREVRGDMQIEKKVEVLGKTTDRMVYLPINVWSTWRMMTMARKVSTHVLDVGFQVIR